MLEPDGKILFRLFIPFKGTKMRIDLAKKFERVAFMDFNRVICPFRSVVISEELIELCTFSVFYTRDKAARKLLRPWVLFFQATTRIAVLRFFEANASFRDP